MAPSVSFEAVKEQLNILGHNVPDDVIRSFLQDINQSSPPGPAAATQPGGASWQSQDRAGPVLQQDVSKFDTTQRSEAVSSFQPAGQQIRGSEHAVQARCY